MAGLSISLLLATLHILQALSATVEDIRLIGDRDSYIDLKSTRQHILRCTFKAGYDDKVSTVRWFKDKRLVYSWDEGSPDAYAYRPLSGYVSTSEEPQLQNLYLNKFSLDLSGNYTCEVDSALGITRSNPFRLVILDVPNDDFQTNVTLLQSIATTSNLPNCTLLWDFRTPAIYPKPNVTCGYYSYLHDDVINYLPAGLTMHLLTNGSWEAEFHQTHIQVAEIPRKERLGCIISVPDTSYKKVVKFEDSYIIDHLIDSEGCPTLSLDPMHRFQISSEEGELNCRGDMIPTSNEIPSKINFRCSPNDVAVFFNGTVVPNWSSELICDSELKVWGRIDNGVTTPVTNITNILPICVPWIMNAAITVSLETTKITILLSFVHLYTLISNTLSYI